MVVMDFTFTSTVLTAAFAFVAVRVFLIIYSARRFNKKYMELPQTPSYPIIGHTNECPGPNDAGLKYQRDLMVKFPRFHLLWIGHLPVVYVSHPDLVKIILKSSEPKAYSIYRFLHPWLGQGLLTSNGNRWARSRRLLTPAFHFDILKGYIPMKNDLCNDLLEKFESAAKSGASLNAFDHVSMFTLDVILQSTMSYETGCQKEGSAHPYISAVNCVIRQISSRFLNPFLHVDTLFYMIPAGWRFVRDCRFVHKVAEDVITKRQKELENKFSQGENGTKEKKRRQDFLDTLITARDAEGNGLTKREIRDEVDTFLFEGHDTTASALSWCLYSLAEHPDVQKRVQEEVDAIFEDRESDYVLWEDLPKMPYLTMALKEAMRLHAPVPSIMRELTQDIDLDGYSIPKGTDINICSYDIHHHPEVWEDSLKYDPERFAPHNVEKRDPFAFVPFSAGPRNCIGQNFAMEEMKIALARILHRYKLSLDPAHKVAKFPALVMKAENDIKLLVKARSSK